MEEFKRPHKPEIDVGDVVRVIDDGKIYPGYTAAAEALGITKSWQPHSVLGAGALALVVGVVLHPKGYAYGNLVAIEVSGKRTYIIASSGLELVPASRRSVDPVVAVQKLVEEVQELRALVETYKDQRDRAIDKLDAIRAAVTE